MIKAYAAKEPGAKLQPFEYAPAQLGADEVDVDVQYCGICHSDLSMLNNDWGMSTYPLVAGHEAVGRVAAVGPAVKHLKIGQTVGVGWFSGFCGVCPQCVAGAQNLCSAAEQTIVGRHGGFAERVRSRAGWAIALPDDLDPRHAGPLFCGGITVFGPMHEFDVRPTDRVGVVGIGGLGHLALRFARAWGCDVTAFSSNPKKAADALEMGAHRCVSSNDSAALEKIRDSLDFILVTTNVPLDWGAYLAALNPKGRLHFVGAVPEPISFHVMQALGKRASISASPLGNPATVAKMLEFCVRHKIAPTIETFPMSRINEALDHLRAGKARYRIVLDASS